MSGEGFNWEQVTFETAKAVSSLAQQVSTIVSTVETDHKTIFKLLGDQNEKYEKLRLNVAVGNEKMKPVTKIVLGASGAILVAFINAVILLVFKKSGII